MSALSAVVAPRQPDAMNHVGVDAASVTEAVAATFSNAKKPRMAQLLPMLVRHAHAFIREGQVSHAEWRAALQFLTDCGDITTPERNEFSLLSDILGISSLVDLQSHQANATPGSVLGPFHSHDSRQVENSVDLIARQEGEPVLFRGRVCDVNGAPLAGASIDFWQNAANSLYPAQDPGQDPHNLRCKLDCATDGSFELRTVRPQPYSVPYDGPVGKMLTEANRHCMRPAHFHLIVEAPGYRPLVTEIFPDDSDHLDSDAVFGVRKGLTVKLTEVQDSALGTRHKIAVPFRLAEFEFRLGRV
jgi:protocatechuate 3,4-dioxygenase beta subunit